MGYAELHCLSNFSFLRGASHPEELVERAVALGYAALALTDECSVAGLVRAHVAARGTGLALIAGTELRLELRMANARTRPPLSCVTTVTGMSNMHATVPAITSFIAGPLPR